MDKIMREENNEGGEKLSYFETHFQEINSIQGLKEYLRNCAIEGKIELVEDENKTTIVNVSDLLSIIQSVERKVPGYGPEAIPGKNLRAAIRRIIN